MLHPYITAFRTIISILNYHEALDTNWPAATFAEVGLYGNDIFFLDITTVAATVGIDVCRALVGVHAYTGCDTVSAFAGKGKAKALKLLSKNKEIQDTFFKLGQEWDLSPDLMNKLEAYTSLLYAPKTSSTKINDLDTTCSVLRKVRLRVISFHHAGTAWKSMP